MFFETQQATERIWDYAPSDINAEEPGVINDEDREVLWDRKDLHPLSLRYIVNESSSVNNFRFTVYGILKVGMSQKHA